MVKLVLLFVLFALCSCVNRAQLRADELAATVRSMAGQHKDNFIRTFGAPSKCTALSSGELCEFTSELGIKSESASIPIGDYSTGVVYASLGSSQARRTFETVTVEFDSNGLAIHGKAQVQY